MKYLTTLGFAAALSMTSMVAEAKTYISFGSCPVGCTSYTWTAGIAEVLNRNVKDIEAVAEGTKGYIDNARLLSKGDLQVAMATSSSAVDAYKGQGAFEGVEPGRMVSWMSIAPTYLHVISLDGTEINSLADLKGKNVGMGQPGGTSLIDAEVLMKTMGFEEGKDFKPFKIRLVPMTDGLVDGNVDVALWVGSIPLGPVIKLTATQKMNLLAITDEELAALQKANPAYFRVSLPAGTYKGQGEAVETYGNGNAMTIDAKLPDDLVYEMTKAIMTNLESLAKVHPALAKMSKDTVLKGFSVPLHPGALRYYREIGVPGIEEFAEKFPSK